MQTPKEKQSIFAIQQKLTHKLKFLRSVYDKRVNNYCFRFCSQHNFNSCLILKVLKLKIIS